MLRIILISLFLFSQIFLFSRDYNQFETYNSRSGLSSDMIYGIVEDNDGFVWFCTGDGLVRFDGYDFKNFDIFQDNNYNIPVSKFLCLAIDNKGRFWFGTEKNGIYIFDKISGSIEVINNDTTQELNILNNRVQHLFLDNQERMWISTQGGLSVYDCKTGVIKSFNVQHPISGYICPDGNVLNVYQNSRGQIYIGTWENGLLVYDEKTDSFKNYKLILEEKEHQLKANRINTIHEDNNGNLWLGTWEAGVYVVKINGEKLDIIKNLNYKNNVGQVVYSIIEDENNAIWIGSSSGLSILNEDFNLINYSSNYIKDNVYAEVSDIIVDRSGTIWLSTFGSGISKNSKSSNYFYTYTINTTQEKLLTSTVTAIHYKNSNEIYIGLRGNGFGSYNLNTQEYTRISLVSKRFGDIHINSAYCFYKDSQGFLWIGTRYNNLIRWNEKTGESILVIGNHIPNLTNSNFSINSIVEDENNCMWVGTSFGLLKLIPSDDENKYKVLKFDYDKEYSDNGNEVAINRLMIDSDGVLWIATSGNGIAKSLSDIGNHENLEFYFDKDTLGINCNVINTIVEDKDRNVWIGTRTKGLVLFDRENKKYISFSEKDNIPSSRVYDVIPQSNGNLWLSTNKGLAEFYYKDFQKPFAQKFVVDDGLQGSDFYMGAAVKSDDGRVFFGGYNGINIISPNQIFINQYKPPVVITDMKVNYKQYQLNKLKSNRIVLKHTDNNVEFSFSALSYSQNYKNMYAYKLEGFDDDWFYTDYSKRSVNYTNLPPGDYTFLVKASNNSFIWNDEPTKLIIEVKPAIYNTWFAYVLYVLIVASIFILILRTRVKIQQFKIKEQEKVNEFKLNFFTNITHEFLTPLSVISAYIEDSKEKKQFNVQMQKSIERNINRLSRLVNQLLDFRKIETSNMPLRVSESNINILFSEIWESYKPLSDKMDISYSIEGSVDTSVFVDVDKLEKVLSNIISNAFKHTPNSGKIILQYKVINEFGKNWLVFKVIDSGTGIFLKDNEDIFKQFYQGENNNDEASGVGIGLALSKSFVNLHKGSISFENRQDTKGTIFRVKIPVDKNSYNENEIVLSKENVGNGNRNIEVEEYFETGYSENVSEILPIRDISVLVVEDNNDLRKVICSYLTDYYNVYSAKDGKEGYEVALEKFPDIIISDVMMPEMDGFEMTDKIKTNTEINHIQVILLTAKVSPEDRNKGYLTGADSYMPKPVNLRLLHARIVSLIKQRERFKDKFGDGFMTEEVKNKMSEIDREFLDRLFNTIKKNMQDTEMSVTFIANKMSLSTASLYRKTSSLTGMSTVELIKYIRLQEAKRMLLEKNLNVNEISTEVGFKSSSYFVTSFKEQFGKTPKKFGKTE